jgi:hypothetical protein
MVVWKKKQRISPNRHFKNCRDKRQGQPKNGYCKMRMKYLEKSWNQSRPKSILLLFPRNATGTLLSLMLRKSHVDCHVMGFFWVSAKRCAYVEPKRTPSSDQQLPCRNDNVYTWISWTKMARNCDTTASLLAVRKPRLERAIRSLM